jgi:hypothetical protein
VNGEFHVNYHKLMLYYNEHILEKEPSVSFGNAMSIMVKKDIILPPKPNMQKVVIFCGERISEFLQTNRCRV